MTDLDTLINRLRRDTVALALLPTAMYAQVDADVREVIAALTDARARLATAETLARAVSDSGNCIDACAEECVHCHAEVYFLKLEGSSEWTTLLNHAPDCPVTLARALLAEDTEPPAPTPEDAGQMRLGDGP